MNKATKFIFLIAILLICWFLGRFFDFDVEYYRNLLNQYPLFLSGFIFVASYIILTFFIWFGAKDVFRISSAVLYGPLVSTILVFLGEMGNACVLFYLSRVLGQEYVAEKFKIKKEDLDKARQEGGFLGSFTLRINPFIPFRLQDLGAGLSQITFKKYLTAIILASPGRIYWLQYILAGVGASVFKDPEFMMQYLFDNPHILTYSSLYFLFIIFMTVVYMVTKISKKKRERVDSTPEA